jgi:integral membrane protein
MFKQLLNALQSPMGRFRLTALAEGVSLLVLLFVTMPLKYLADMPAPNYFFGMAHGLLFILYVLLLLQVAIAGSWSFKKIALAFVAAFVPFGTFWAEKRLY